MSKYPKINDYEGVVLDSDQILHFACCDCGLVHAIAVVPEDDGKVAMAFRRETRATAQLRRYEYGYLQQGQGERYRMVRTP